MYLHSIVKKIHHGGTETKEVARRPPSPSVMGRPKAASGMPEATGGARPGSFWGIRTWRLLCAHALCLRGEFLNL